MDDFFYDLATKPEFKQYAPQVLSEDPWVIQLDSFLTGPETEAVVNDADQFVRSKTVIDKKDDYRNSSSWQCVTTECNKHPGIQSYFSRLTSTLHLGLEHAEGLSVLKYEEGGYYKKHHDLIPRDLDQNCYDSAGPRVVTFMTYLTDAEDGDGGETSFYYLNKKVQPKKGRAVVWADMSPNYHPSRGFSWAQDVRTSHEALVVNRGTKMTATTWFRLLDYAGSKRAECC